MSDLCYLNARMRAMRGRLMRRPHYETLLAEPDLPAIAARLMEGPYARSLESAGPGAADPVRLEEGLRRHLSQTLLQLSRRAAGDPREAVRSVLGYWDLHNLKTILRGKANGMPAEAIHAALIPAGCLEEAVLVELLSQPDLRAAAGLLESRRDPAGRALSAALADYREPRDLFILETALDRDYFRRAFSGLDRVRLAEPDRAALGAFLSAQADRINLLTALKAAEDRIALLDRNRYFIPGGRIVTAERFARLLSARSLSEAFEAGRSFYGELFRDPGEPVRGLSPISLVERRLDGLIRKTLRFHARVDPLGLGAVILGLLDYAAELSNLRMIIRGRLIDLPDADFMPFLSIED